MIATTATTADRFTLITGATGFIGHVLLTELLHRGHNCAVLIRRPSARTIDALDRALLELGLNGHSLRAGGRLVILHGDLPDALPDELPVAVDRIVHAAASTRFDTNSAGEPARSNDAGTAALLRAAERWHVSELHLVSTAFVCGRMRGDALERFTHEPCAQTRILVQPE